MITIFGTHILATALGAGAAFINDFFFFISLKDHRLSKHEIISLKQLNNLQVIFIVWVILTEIALLAYALQFSNLFIGNGALLAKIIIELTVLFCSLLLRQVYIPELIRKQHQYHHLSDSFLQHSNQIIATCAVSTISWFFIILITSSIFNMRVGDFGFIPTILTYIIICLLMVWLMIAMKNKILHRKHSKI